MNPKIPIVLGATGILAAIGTAVANANGVFTGHPHLMYWFYGGAFVLIVVAVILASATRKEPTDPAQIKTEVKDSFNPTNSLTANPTINIYPIEKKQLHMAP